MSVFGNGAPEAKDAGSSDLSTEDQEGASKAPVWQLRIEYPEGTSEAPATENVASKLMGTVEP